MSSENYDEQKTANLARIRDNQRRSRARRKEYLQELEERYRVCEQLGVEASAEMQAAARRVIEENRRLRVLLKRHGYTDMTIDQAVHDGTSQAQSAAALEALFNQRVSCNTSLQMPDDLTHAPGKRMPPPSSSTSQSPIIGVGIEQFGASQASGTIVQQKYADDALTGSSSSSMQPVTPYNNSSARWPQNLYQHTYSAQPGGHVADANVRIMASSHNFDLPSLQTIKSEIGYDPQQEELDSQKADAAEYGLSDEQYDAMKRFS